MQPKVFREEYDTSPDIEHTDDLRPDLSSTFESDTEHLFPIFQNDTVFIVLDYLIDNLQ